MSHVSQRLSFREKAGYSLGDAATNFFFQAMIMYQTTFYTDVMGVSAAAIGVLFLVVRLLDGVFDPVMGIVADRTNTRMGKFRPWVLWMALPFGLILWLAYTVPSFGGTGKLIYVCVTYTLLMMVYSASNTPYSALNGVMTGDVSERTSLAQYRFVAAMAATLVVQGMTLPLVDKFGGADKSHGYSVTFGIFGALAVVFFIVAALVSKERIKPDPKQQTSVAQDIKDVFRCRPWVVMFVITLCIFTTLAVRGSGMYYYFSYYVDQGALLEFVKRLGLGNVDVAQSGWWIGLLDSFGFIMNKDASNVTSVGFSIFNMAGNLVTIVGVLMSKALAERFGKRTVFTAGVLGTAIVTAAIYFVPANGILTLLLLGLLWPACYGPTIPLLWAMIADVADYSEWKTGRRATGFVYAGVVFALKAGLGFGGAIIGGLLTYYGYVANAVQTPAALEGIRLNATVWASVPFFLSVVALCFYPISKKLNLDIQDELAERRKKFNEA